MDRATKKNKISLTRTRPERSKQRHLSIGDTVSLEISVTPADKNILQAEAKKRQYSLSLYVNLILTGQEKSPLV